MGPRELVQNEGYKSWVEENPTTEIKYDDCGRIKIFIFPKLTPPVHKS